MKIIYGTLLLLALLSGKAFTADSVNIGVTGNIVATPCIFNGGSNSLDVNLGNIQATNMATPGSTSDRCHLVCCSPSAQRERRV